MITCRYLCHLCLNCSITFYFEGCKKLRTCEIGEKEDSGLKTRATANDREKLIQAYNYCEDTELQTLLAG